MDVLEEKISINRSYRFDNIRFCLVLLVVIDHMFETTDVGIYGNIFYKLIYTFHVPALIFLSGYFAKFRPEKILKRIIMPYFVFQMLYLLFDYYCINNVVDTVFQLQFTTPYWLMWFILVLGYYYISLQLWSRASKRIMLAVLAVSIFIALVAGYDATLGYYMSLSRAIVFFPFFVAGQYASSYYNKGMFTKKYLKIVVFSIAIFIVIIENYLISTEVKAIALYGSYNYSDSGSNIFIRSAFFISAFLWIALLSIIVPNSKVPVITYIGQNTLSIYILHGFFQRIVQKYGIIHGTPVHNMIIAVLMAIALVFVLSLKPISLAFKRLF